MIHQVNDAASWSNGPCLSLTCFNCHMSPCHIFSIELVWISLSPSSSSVSVWLVVFHISWFVDTGQLAWLCRMSQHFICAKVVKVRAKIACFAGLPRLLGWSVPSVGLLQLFFSHLRIQTHVHSFNQHSKTCVEVLLPRRFGLQRSHEVGTCRLGPRAASVPRAAVTWPRDRFCLQGSLEFQKPRVLLNLQHLLCIRRAGCEGGRPSFSRLQG